MLEGCQVPEDTLCFLNGYAEDNDRNWDELKDLRKEHELLKELSAKQDRYIAELEKQLTLLQKTLELVDRNMKGVRENG
jgi:hypothetical protein